VLAPKVPAADDDGGGVQVCPLIGSVRGMRLAAFSHMSTEGRAAFPGRAASHDRVTTALAGPATRDPRSRVRGHLAARRRGRPGAGRSISARLVLAAAIALALTGAVTAEGVNRVVIEGTLKRGDEFAQAFGPGFTFRLRGRDVWAIVITHAASPDRDLVYPVNPPYRFSNRQYVGPGYGESARDSVGSTPRELAFLYRPGDIGRAWDDLERVLWPYTHAEAEVERAISELGRFPTGALVFEILSAEVGPDESRTGAGGRDECVRTLRFRVTITWPDT